MILTNETNIPLILAGWVVDDTYDYQNDKKFVSATGLIKPIKSTILEARVDKDNLYKDISEYIPSALGSTIHVGIETAWTQRYKENLLKLGYNQNVIDKIEVNPSNLNPDKIQIYFEKRTKKLFNGWIIGGKFDAVCDGILHDFKSTSVYTYIYGSHDEDYKLQGSIYRWLNPEIITSDFIRICFIFTDWSKANQQQNPANYPPSRLLTKDIPLMSIEETEAYIKAKTDLLERYVDKEEGDIPECTDAELWRPDPVYKYYANPDNMVRATKNFSSLAEANAYKTSKGKGVVVTVLGEPKRCKYCPGSPVCEQRRRYKID